VSVLEHAKRCCIWAISNSSIGPTILNSKWRQQRLPLLCFHGISTADEHKCFPGFFITEQMFRRKLRLISALNLSVLPLDEAIRRLMNGTLPKRSIVITLDDGYYGAYAHGRPILNEFGYPATVYMTTHYIHHNRAVFDNMCRYLLWRAQHTELAWERVFPRPMVIDANTLPTMCDSIHEYARSNRLTSLEKDRLLHELAEHLSIDFEELRRRRLFHLVRPDEMRTWKNVTFELHTHRHRVSRERGVFTESVARNASEIRTITGRECRHFAYPGGTYLPEHPEWLRGLGIKSAVTCVTGLLTPTSDLMKMPRIMDTADVRLEELESWMSGYAALLPTRRYPLDLSQLEDSASLAPA
jgi:peptidoglycan/xylan/chitin deacetylase (PgdA/CDA1 family)